MPSKPTFPKRIPTNLVGQKLVFSGMEELTLVRADLGILNRVDASWPLLRPANAENEHWRWLTIARRSPDCFALIDAQGEVQGLWCSRAESPRKSDTRRYYRLDYLEVHPARRRTHTGLVLLTCIAARAKEQDCDGVFLSSLPSATVFWDKFGTRRCPHGWTHASGLVPFMIEEKLETLARMFHEARSSA